MNEQEHVRELWEAALDETEVAWCRGGCGALDYRSHAAGVASATTVHLSWAPDDRVSLHRALYVLGWIVAVPNGGAGLRPQQRSLLAFDWATEQMRTGDVPVPRPVLEARPGPAEQSPEVIGEVGLD